MEWLLVLVVPLAFLLILGLVLVVISQAWRPSLSIAQARSRVVGGVWNARLTASSVPLNPLAGYGTLQVRDQQVSFIPDGQVQPAWSYPAREFGAGRQSRLLGSTVWLGHRALGYLTAEVSAERINRISRNSAKSGRQAVYADAFLQQLGEAGASIHPG